MRRNAVAIVGSAGSIPHALRRRVEALGRLIHSAGTPGKNLSNGTQQIREANK